MKAKSVQDKGTGGFSTLLVEGVDQVEAYLRMILPRMTKLVIVPVMLLVLLFILDWVSALIGLLVFPAIILQEYGSYWPHRQPSKRQAT